MCGTGGRVFLVGCTMFVASCASAPWERTDELTARLRCGMSEVEAIAEAQKLGRVRAYRQAPSYAEAELVIVKGTTQIVLDLENDRVRNYQVNWASGFMKRPRALKRDLCSAKLYVELHVLGDASAAGSAVFLDGKRVGALSGLGSLTLDVPLGEHQLRIDTPGNRSWSTDLRYDETSSGYDVLQVGRSTAQ